MHVAVGDELLEQVAHHVRDAQFSHEGVATASPAPGPWVELI